MERRDFLASLIASALTLPACTRTGEAPARTRPNILWISLEDVTPMMGCYGDRYARTPVFDSLAAEGIRYTRAHAVSPVCSPSRSSVITGMYPSSLGSMHHRSGAQPPEKTRLALQSLFRYNFQTDVGPYIENAPIKPVRFFALPGEAGTVICSFPKGGADRAPGNVRGDWEKLVVGYFSERMTGFEYQAAAQMIDEELAAEGFAIIKVIDERYRPSKRNPYNEVEYGNHYSRAMSSYGCLVAACGFEYHGPKGVLGFAPKLSPENFRAPFTVAQGWGTFRASNIMKKYCF